MAEQLGKVENKENRGISYTKEKGGLIHIAMSINMGNPDTTSGGKNPHAPIFISLPPPPSSFWEEKEQEEPQVGRRGLWNVRNWQRTLCI